MMPTLSSRNTVSGAVSEDSKLASYSLWRHAMKKLSALPTLCEGNPPVTGGFTTQRAGNADFEFFFDVSLNK